MILPRLTLVVSSNENKFRRADRPTTASSPHDCQVMPPDDGTDSEACCVQRAVLVDQRWDIQHLQACHTWEPRNEENPPAPKWLPSRRHLTNDAHELIFIVKKRNTRNVCTSCCMHHIMPQQSLAMEQIKCSTSSN